MQLTLAAAALMTVLVGLAHSVLGEKLMFARLRRSGWVPNQAAGPLSKAHVSIIWASWHALTVFGFVLAAVLMRLAWPVSAVPLDLFVKNAVILGMLASALLVLVGTRARHPGWIGLLMVGLLSWIAQ